VKRRLALAGGVLALLIGLFGARAARSADTDDVRFRPVAIYLDSSSSISAYQVEVQVTRGRASFVGVEGGDGIFAEPPFYDPEALSDDGRIVLAAFNAHDALPAGRHRVATLHVREVGAPAGYRITVTAVADSEARRVDARGEVEPMMEAP
jgi:hypothetical protein